MAKQIYVSAVGLTRLQQKLEIAREELLALRKEKVVAYTASGDTWHDNPYFNRLDQDERRKVSEIAEITDLLSGAQVILPATRNLDRIALGSIVRIVRTYLDNDESEELVLEVVGYGETDTNRRQVAYNSPMMKLLMGHCANELVEATTPRGPVEYEIIALYPDWEAVEATLL